MTPTCLRPLVLAAALTMGLAGCKQDTPPPADVATAPVAAAEAEAAAQAEAAAPAIARTLAALSDAVVALLPTATEHDDLLVAARAASVPVFALAPTVRTPIPASTRRLRAGKSGLRTLSAALGVHLDGPAAVQQERLF